MKLKRVIQLPEKNELLMTCNDCGTTENVGEIGLCSFCEADFEEILESMNDVEEDEEE